MLHQSKISSSIQTTTTSTTWTCLQYYEIDYRALKEIYKLLHVVFYPVSQARTQRRGGGGGFKHPALNPGGGGGGGYWLDCWSKRLMMYEDTPTSMYVWKIWGGKFEEEKEDVGVSPSPSTSLAQQKHPRWKDPGYATACSNMRFNTVCKWLHLVFIQLATVVLINFEVGYKKPRSEVKIHLKAFFLLRIIGANGTRLLPLVAVGINSSRIAINTFWRWRMKRAAAATYARHNLINFTPELSKGDMHCHGNKFMLPLCRMWFRMFLHRFTIFLFFFYLFIYIYIYIYFFFFFFYIMNLVQSV